MCEVRTAESATLPTCVRQIRQIRVLNWDWGIEERFLGFSESLERDLSNGVIKVHIWEINVFANLVVPWIIAHGPRPKNDKLGPRWNFGLKHIIWKVIFWAFGKSWNYWHWINCTQVMAVERCSTTPPPPPFHQSLSAAITWILWIQSQKFYDFLKA